MTDKEAKNKEAVVKVLKEKEELIQIASLEADGVLYESVLTKEGPRFAFIDSKTHFPAITNQVGDFIPMYGEEVRQGVVLMPSRALTFIEVGDLIKQIREYITRYCDLPENIIKMSSYYVLLTYVYDRLDQIPYLSFMGDTGTGKSRCKQVIGSICYLPIFASGGATPPALYRIIDKWHGTLLIDESDFHHSDETQEVMKLLNCGFEKHSPRIVCDTNDPSKLQFHNPFGPKIIARRFEFHDKATESRCITHITSETRRNEIPVVLPRRFYAEAEELRNRLITFRLAYYHKFENPIENLLNDLKIEPRIKQAYTSLALVLSPFPDELAEFKKFLLEKQEELVSERSVSWEGLILTSYISILEEGKVNITSKEIGVRVYEQSGEEMDARKVGRIMKALGFKSERKWVGAEQKRLLSIDVRKFANLKARYGIMAEFEKGGCDNSDKQTTPIVLKENLRDSGIIPTGGDVTPPRPYSDVCSSLTSQKKTDSPQEKKVSNSRIEVPHNPDTLLAQIPRDPVPYETLKAVLCDYSGWTEAELDKYLTHLKKAGDIIEVRPGHYIRT